MCMKVIASNINKRWLSSLFCGVTTHALKAELVLCLCRQVFTSLVHNVSSNCCHCNAEFALFQSFAPDINVGELCNHIVNPKTSGYKILHKRRNSRHDKIAKGRETYRYKHLDEDATFPRSGTQQTHENTTVSVGGRRGSSWAEALWDSIDLVVGWRSMAG